jgi:monolysocardiolipin acyltransferase
MWAILPLSTFFPFARPSHTCHNVRWTLGGELQAQRVSLTPASDIMFTSPPLSKFFTAGQVIDTVRGAGIYQPAVDAAIKRVQDGGWVSEVESSRVESG